MNTFINAMNNISYTENGALTNKSTQNDFVDLFYNIANPLNDVYGFEDLLSKCLLADQNLTYRILMYGRDILEGGGRRDRFITALLYLIDKHKSPSDAISILSHSATVGISYYKDWIHLFDKSESIEFKSNTVKIFSQIVQKFIDGVPFETHESNLLKWLPRKGKLFNEIRKHLRITPKELRKTLVNNGTSVEQVICAKQWDDVHFERVPGRSMLLHSTMFRKREETSGRFAEYLANVAAGKSNMNVGKTVAAYEALFQPLDFAQASFVTMLDALNKVNSKVMVVTDTSDSMNQTPNKVAMKVSLSLAALFGTALTGEFHNTVIAFSKTPRFVSWDDNDDISTILNTIRNDEMPQNTDLQAVFNLILGLAISKNIPQSDMPEYILIISDMQFDQAIESNHNYSVDNISLVKKKYTDAGYEVPQIIFWNVNANGYNNSPITADERGIMVSGYSQNIWNSMFDIENLKEMNPFDFVKEIVGKERYELK